MNARRVTTLGLALIAAVMLPVGLQATLWPRSFFDDFPVGRGWIVADGGAYNEHFTRDVGGLFLALIVVTVWAIWRRQAARPAAVAWLLQGVLHVTYHGRHLDGYDGIDKVGLTGSLAAIPILAIIVLWFDARESSMPGDRTPW